MLANAFKYLKYAKYSGYVFKNLINLPEKVHLNISFRRIVQLESLQEEFTIKGEKELQIGMIANEKYI